MLACGLLGEAGEWDHCCSIKLQLVLSTYLKRRRNQFAL